jgi:hypothetical protein
VTSPPDDRTVGRGRASDDRGLHIQLIQMMENEVRNARFLEGDSRGREVVVLAGTGGNGGGARRPVQCRHDQRDRARAMKVLQWIP